MIVCLADSSEHKDREALHRYLRAIKMRQEDYYTTYHPRFDLFSGEKIPFSNSDQYLNTDFINKHNIKKFIKQKPDEAKAWAINWLKKRKEIKSLIYPPTQVELRTLPCPTIRYFNSVGGYNNICAEIGYKIRFNDEADYNPLPIGVEIIQDTREQKPLEFPLEVKAEALNVGDYGISGSKIRIERKEIKDFVSSLTTRKGNILSNKKVGIDRIRAELVRARESGLYVVMVVEESIENALSFNYLPQLRFAKVRPEHVFRNLRQLLIEFADCFQAVFVRNRYEAVQIILRIFEAGESIKNIDIQYHYEEGSLCGSSQKTL